MENSFEIINAISVAEAFKKMAKQQFDAIVSDYEMPLKNGLEFLKELREQNNQIPFILFTGRGREDVAVKALNLGADSYINKNGSPETVYCELADAINKTVERKKSRELLAKSESKYHALVENSLQGIAILQVAPIRIVFANSALGKILGYSSEELTSLSPAEIMSLVYHEDRAVFFKRMENRLLGEPAEACFEFRAVRKDGSIIWLSSLANRVDYDGQPAVQGMFLDVNESKKAAEILSESEQRYRELANCLPDIVFETDLNGQLEFANERAAEISGYSRNEIKKGLNIFQFIVPEDRERATKNMKRLLSGGSYLPSEYTFIRKDGTTFPALITATPRVCKNKVTGFRGIVLDISERKKAEEVVKKSEVRYRELANFLPEIVFETDLTGKITFFSQRAFEITGFTPEELAKGVNMLSFVVPEERERATENIKKSLGREDHDASEYTLFKKDGTTYAAVVRTEPIFSENKVQGLRGLVIDITQRKRMEDELKVSEERLRLLFEYAPDAYYLNDLKGTFVDGNKMAEEVTGYTRSELIGKSFLSLNLLPRNQILKAAKLLTSNAMGKPTGPDEFILNRKNGTQILVEIRTHPLKIQGKKLVLGIARDITEREKSEEALRNSEERFRQLVLSSPDTIHLLDPNSHKIEFLNRDEFLGYSRAELEGANSILHWLHPDDRELVQGYYQLVLKGTPDGQSPVEYRLKNKAGNWEWVQSRVTILKHDVEGKPEQILVTLTVITERKKAEEELKIGASIFDLATDAIFVHDLDGNIINFNEAAYKLHGYSKDEMAKMNIHNFNSTESAKWVKPRINTLLKNGSAVFEAVDLCKDKSLLPVEVHARLIELEGKKLILSVVRDVTERKVAEEKLKENNVKIELMNEKLRVVGGLSRHDVGNKLSAVNGYAYLLKKKYSDQSDIVEGLCKIEQAVVDSVKIFDFAKMYEQLGVEKLSNVDVGKAVDEAVALFSGLTFKVVNDCHGLSVLADSFLGQLFYNFIDNTRKYGEKATTIKVYCEQENLGGLRLIYEDNGVGITAENKSKLFSEGFSTGGGTGFGLFLIKKMMAVYGWTITEEGGPRIGAKFVITIPKVNQKKN
jgi:PAS domain S-box-containing protein